MPPSKSIFSFLLRPLSYILLPTIGLLLYWSWYYQPVYECEVVLLPRTGESAIGEATTTAADLLGGGSANSLDSNMLVHYILSPDMLTLLDRDLALRAEFSSQELPFTQRLSSDATADEFLYYYRSMVRVAVDSSAIIKVQAKGFSGNGAWALADRIIHHAEAKLNDVSKEMASKQLDFIRGEVAKAEGLFKDRSAKLTRQQNTSGLLDPAKYSEELMKIIARLERELAEQRAILTGKEQFIAAESPLLENTKTRIKALLDGIAYQRTRLSGAEPTADERFSDAIMHFNEVALEAEFAAKTYAATLLTLQSAQANAALAVRTLIIISRPERIESPTYPRTGYWVLTAFALAALLLVLGRLIYDSVMSHVDR